MPDPNTPTAEGTFSRTPFLHLVLYLYQHRETGTLVIETSGVAADLSQANLLFQRGRAVALLARPRIEPLERALLPLCVSSAAFRFYASDLLVSGSEIVTGMFDPHAFVLSAVRAYPDQPAIQEVIARFATERLRLQPEVDLARFGFERTESTLIDVLKAEPATIAELSAHSELSPQATRALIYALLITKAVAPHVQRSTDAHTTHERPRPPWSTSPSPPIRTSSQPRIASVSAAPGTPSVPSAPSLSGSSSAPPRPPRMDSPAGGTQRVSPPRSGTSLRPPSPSSGAGKPTPRPSMAPAETLDAAGKFRRAEQLCQRRAYDEALPLIRSLCEEQPDVAKHHGLLAFVMLGRTVDDGTMPKEVVESVNRALRLNEDDVYGLYTKALSYKRGNRQREALHYFRRTVSVDPNHIEAAREIRLFGMRHADDKKP